MGPRKKRTCIAGCSIMVVRVHGVHVAPVRFRAARHITFSMAFFRTIFSKQFLWTLVLSGLLVLICVPLSRNWRQKRSVDREIQELKTQVGDLEHTNSNLKNVLEYMQSDQFVEEEARTKLNYKKPGEEVVVVESRPGEVPTASGQPDVFAPPAETPVQPEPKVLVNVGKWTDYFFAGK